MQITIIKPIITEASVKDANTGKFTFLVAHEANKTLIRQDIEKIYGVTVTGISTVTIRRRKTIYTKFGRKKVEDHIKKARVKLKTGQTIAAFDIKSEEDKKVKKEKKEKKEDK